MKKFDGSKSYCGKCKNYLPRKEFLLPKSKRGLMCNLCNTCIIEIGKLIIEKDIELLKELSKT